MNLGGGGVGRVGVEVVEGEVVFVGDEPVPGEVQAAPHLAAPGTQVQEPCHIAFSVKQ